MKMGMTNVNSLRLMRRFALAMILASMGLVASSGARADSFLGATEPRMFYKSATDTISFDTDSAGTVTAMVSTLPFPTPLASLSFSVTNQADTLASFAATSMSGPQVETFQVDGAGTYFAHITATAGASALNLGVYSVIMTFTPVPLPAAAGLLLIGIFVVLALRSTLRAPRNESVMYPA